MNSIDTDTKIHKALRPNNLDEFVGQEKIREQLSLVLEAAKIRKTSADHILLSGPPGLGKTTLSMIVAQEMNTSLRITSGPAIKNAGDLAAILSSLTEGDVIFIDEIHRIPHPAEEMLYIAMEDFRVDVVVGKGPGATSVKLDLPNFTLVGATTRIGFLQGPLRDRFGFCAHLDFYTQAEIEKVILRSAKLLNLKIDDKALSKIASRSRGTPRIANKLLKRVCDWVLVNGGKNIDSNAVDKTCKIYNVSNFGLDRLDYNIIDALINKFSGGPVGISTLAVTIGEDINTLETIAEPFLIRKGLICRTSRGRIALPPAYKYLKSYKE